MPVPHFNIKITQRSKGKSAVAGAAYQAGEKLFSEYDQKTKNYTCKKEVVYTEIMLPPNAPPEYADRATLWNSVEEIEKQWNSQLARRFVAALPREVPMELLPQMVKEYCEEQFVSKGMCCDFAIHDPDPPGHNPHCHFMLTMRAIDENGKWMPISSVSISARPQKRRWRTKSSVCSVRKSAKCDFFVNLMKKSLTFRLWKNSQIDFDFLRRSPCRVRHCRVA